MEANKKIFWAFNLPLQVWPDDSALSTDADLLNYEPRKQRCSWLRLSDVLFEQSREEFFETAARKLEMLAQQMRQAGSDPKLLVYYPDEPPSNSPTP